VCYSIFGSALKTTSLLHMTLSFGQQLHAFALAVDLVSEEALGRVLEMITEYVRRELQVHFFEVLVATPIGRAERRPGLRSEWHPGGENWSETIFDSDGRYNGQVSYAFDKQCELWIVSADSETLENAARFDNLLPTHTLGPDFPRFKDLTSAGTCTSVICPMKIGNRLVGLINLESTELLKPTKTLQTEVSLIAEAIGQLYLLKEAGALQRDSTRRALTNLAALSEDSLAHQRRVFIASSAKADKRVVEIIRHVVAETAVEEVFWEEDPQSGDITEHIWRNISTSEIGICYLSERDAGESAYRDNQNVLFEAGMMHALTHSARVMRAWIPVREQNSPAAPFDFSTERMLIVPRDERNEIDEVAFAERLRRRLVHLIDDKAP
jgi:predicted nucleotide-binding protein